MADRRSRTVDAIVLRSFDVGEADRFCILLTREMGRLPVRVPGARKTASRLGGSVLALRRVRVDVHDRGDGVAVVRSANVLVVPERIDADAFAALQQASELILRFTDDRQEVPELYDACVAFFDAPADRRDMTVFTATVLHLLGVLPLSVDDRRFAALPAPARTSLQECVRDAAHRLSPVTVRDVDRFLASILEDHLTSPLIVPEIRAALA